MGRRGWCSVIPMAAVTLCPAAGTSQQADSVPDRIPAWDLELSVETLADGVRVPSAIVFLPDGTALLAERSPARLSRLDPESRALRPIGGLPTIHTDIGAGLLDVALHPEFEINGLVYYTWSEAVTAGSTLALDVARLVGDRLVDRRTLFRATPAFDTDDHFGGRIALRDGYLYVTSGDRLTRDLAQTLGSHNGKILRLRDDGSVPEDNPFVEVDGALPEIWSYGHRNPQGLTFHPETGELWAHEHGPRGGDEVNIVRPGRNYGWPLVTYGGEYEGGPVGEGLSSRPGLEPPLYFFRPSIAPSGMSFYRSARVPAWDGALLVAALRGHLGVLTVGPDRVLHEERVLGQLGWRVRSLAVDPEGRIVLALDGGRVVRLDAVPER